MKVRLAAKAYAWMFDFGIAAWALPTMAQLQSETKPSPEAKIRRCYIVSEGEYKRLRIAERAFLKGKRGAK